MIGDSPEQIERCLNCLHKKCINCIAHKREIGKAGRKKKPVIAYREGEEDMHFVSADEAGEFFHVTAVAVRHAALYGTVCCDYFWRYDNESNT